MFGTSGPLAINASLYRKLNHDPLRSFTPVINIGYLPNVLIVNAAVPGIASPIKLSRTPATYRLEPPDAV